MFPIVPSQLIRHPSSSSSDPNRSVWQQQWSTFCKRDNLRISELSDLKRPQETVRLSPGVIETVGLVAGDLIPRGVVSNSFAPTEMLTKQSQVSDEPLKLKVNSRNNLLECCDKYMEFSWIRHIKLADDIHDANVYLESVPAVRHLRLCVKKSVAKGEEIRLWFGENLVTLMAIPFLTPGNIRNKTTYICHLCKTTFEYPNRLKIHLATDCGQDNESILWQRLVNGLNHQNQNVPTNRPPAISLSQRISAFQPVLTPPRFTMAMIPENITAIHQTHNRLEDSTVTAAAAAAQLETIVSNMGTSKQGHLCIYCGKLYSRKYGLKIHIRTHTGFKPLKCKFCLRPFGDPSNLNKHIRLHVQGNSNIYRCHLCEKVLMRRRDLQRHLQTRHNTSDLDDDQTTVGSNSQIDAVSSRSSSDCDDNDETDMNIDVD